MAAQNYFFIDQVVDNNRDLFLKRHFVRLEMDFRILRRFVRIVDAGEILDLTRTRLFVQALRVTFFGYSQRAINKNLYEIQACLRVQAANLIAVGLVRADKARQGNCALVSKQFRDFANTPNIFRAVRFRKTEVLVYAETDIVPVQSIRKLPEPE